MPADILLPGIELASQSEAFQSVTSFHSVLEQHLAIEMYQKMAAARCDDGCPSSKAYEFSFFRVT